MPISRSRIRIGLLAASLLLLATPLPSAAQGLALDLVEVADALVLPVALAHAGDGSDRLFIVQQTGEILILDSGTVLATPFLDLSAKVACCGERGLLGLAFHPDYEEDGELFVNYTRSSPSAQTVVARYTVSVDPDVADAGSEEILLTIGQPFANHNGGGLAFGPDGYLYVSTGDGGGAGDPQENAQDLGTLLGGLLRLDVDSAPDPGLAYAIPDDNPFVGVAGAREELWAYGLRNPWRFSFDRATGDVWIADVGQGVWEEIDLQPAASGGGENYGWDCREGAHPYDDPNGDMNADCPAGGFTEPVLEYQHLGGRCSVTGGYRYRGDGEPRLRGVYLYADFCTGEIFATVPSCGAGAWQAQEVFDAPFNVTAFGEDEAGEVYVTEYRGGNPPPATSKLHLVALAPGSGGPDLATSTGAVDFGTVEVGETVAAVLSIANANAGPEAVKVAAALLSHPDLAVDPRVGARPCGSLIRCLSPGASCTFEVAFKASATSAFDETLSFAGNFFDEVVDLSAEVVPCSSVAHLVLSNETVDGVESHAACDTLTAGPDVTVTGSGDLTLCAGTRVVITDGFRVDLGGRLTIPDSC